MELDLSRDIPVESRRKSFIPQSRVKLGISGFQTPITLETMNGGIITIPATVECIVTADDHLDTVVRIKEQLREHLRAVQTSNTDTMLALLGVLRKLLKSEDVYVKYTCLYPVQVGDQKTVVYYPCTFECRSTDKLIRYYLTVAIKYAVPWARFVRVTINFDPGNSIFPEEMISAIDHTVKCAEVPAPSVNDTASALAAMLDEYSRVLDYVIMCEEEIDEARMLAVTRKGIVGGLR